MKKHLKPSLVIAVAALITSSISFSGCKKDNPQTPAATTAPLIVHLHTDIDTNEVSGYNLVYKTNTGRKFNLSKAQLFISKIQLVKLDGSTVDVSGTILKDVATEEYKMGNIPAGNYKTVQFYVGLDATTDKATPASGDADLSNISMLFNGANTSQGHIFVNFQGKVDTSAAANNTVAQMQSFMYYLGTSDNYKKVVMPDKAFTVTPNETQFVHLNIDYAKLLDGVSLNKNVNLMIMSTSDNASTLGKQIGANITSMFSYEE